MNELTQYGIRGSSAYHFNRAKEFARGAELFGSIPLPVHRDLSALYMQVRHDELTFGLDRLLIEKVEKMDTIAAALATEIAARSAWTDCSCSRNVRYACPHQRAYQEARVRREQMIDNYIASGGTKKEVTQ